MAKRAAAASTGRAKPTRPTRSLVCLGWLNPAFIISVLLLVMPFMLLADVFYIHPAAYVGELRTQIVTGLLAIVFSVAGYWIGTSFSSAKKDDRPQQ